MVIKILNSCNYPESYKINYGDCFIIDNHQQAILFDCGSEEHAKRAVQYFNEISIDKIDVILSHNHADHFDGIMYLKSIGRLGKVYTVLLYTMLEELLNEIDDNRRNSKEALRKQISEEYSNIVKLSGHLENVMITKEIIKGVRFVGPNKDFLIKETARHLDNRESSQIDETSIINATSVQVEIELDSKNKMLLVGDAVVEAFDEKLSNYNLIQLPHHGNATQAQQIFELCDNKDITYYISDNTGTDKGGSDNLYEEKLDFNKKIKNTKKISDDITIDENSILRTSVGNLGSI